MDAIVSTALGFFVSLTGRVVVRVLSFGRWRGESLRTEEGSTFGAAGSLWFSRDGQVVFTETGLLFVGAVFYVVVLICAVILYGLLRA